MKKGQLMKRLKIQLCNNKKMKLILIVLSFMLFILSGCFKNIQKSTKYFDSDNYLIVESKPFFPIGIYSVNPLRRWDPPSAFEEIKAAGFNAVHTYEYEEDYLKEFTKKADSAGLKVLIYPGSRLEQSDFNMNNVKSTVKNLAKSPAILSWYLAEEPDAFNIDPERILNEKDIIRNMIRSTLQR